MLRSALWMTLKFACNLDHLPNRQPSAGQVCLPPGGRLAKFYASKEMAPHSLFNEQSPCIGKVLAWFARNSLKLTRVGLRQMHG